MKWLKYFFVIEIGTIQLDKAPFMVIFYWKCNLFGFNPLDKIQLSLSYLGNSWDKLTSQGIKNYKISFKLQQAVFQQPPWCQDPPLHLLKSSGFTYSHSHKAIQSNLQCKKGRFQLSEMRSGVKMGSPPGFLCHTDKEILCFLKYYKKAELWDNWRTSLSKTTFSYFLKVWGP